VRHFGLEPESKNLIAADPESSSGRNDVFIGGR